MSEALTTFVASMALAETSGEDYKITSPLTGTSVNLQRDIDFMKIPNTKQPTLTKSGSEKICMAYGLMQRFSIESKIENADSKSPIFFYTIKCELVKGFTNANGNYEECVYSTGYGSANTSEKRNGFNDAYNAANSTLKMAQKRALSSAALSISGLSSMFTQDMDNDTFMAGANKLIEETPESPISPKQIKRIYALFNSKGLNQAQAKSKLAEWNISSTKDIKQKDYEELCVKIVNLQ